MYMTDWCPYCMKARESMQKSGRRGVPDIDVEGIGYSPERIKSAVEMKRQL
ncbi:MAG TPA: hypothetical protein VLH56_06270 [Dissulfurispiraceae bacterium]|nr:hypothetical protein [Dissulfurispiraceae bacterium]